MTKRAGATEDPSAEAASAGGRLHRLAIRLLRYARVDDDAQGLSAPRLSVLSVLVFGGPATVTELASAEQVAVPTMTKLLQALERDGFVRRRRDREDARVLRVTATARGVRALEAGRRARIEHVEAVLRHVEGEAAHADIARALATLERALDGAIEARGVRPSPAPAPSRRASARPARRRPSR